MKGIKGFTNAIMMMGCAAVLAACSVEATAPPVNFGAGPGPSSSAAKLMAVEGTWTSDCLRQHGIYMKETTSFADNAVSIKIDMYFATACTGTPNDTQTVNGTMSLVGSSLFVAGGHDVEVAITQPDGAVETTRAVFLLENGVLFTSGEDDHVSGTWPQRVDRSKPYRRVGG